MNIAAKIRKLLEITEDNGATANEAMVAAAKVEKLVRENNINVTELELTEDGFCNFAWFQADSNDFAIIKSCWQGLQKFTNVRIYQSQGVLRFFGYTSDIVFVKWLVPMICRAAKRAFQQERPQDKFGFFKIFGQTIDKMLIEHIKQQNSVVSMNSSGQAVVPINKMANVEAELAKTTPLYSGGKTRGRAVDEYTASSAKAAAGTVNFNRPISAGNSNLRLS